jgi:hypothetical protein
MFCKSSKRCAIRVIAAARIIVMLLVFAGVVGCEAAAQNPSLLSPPGSTASPPAGSAEQRALKTRATLFAQGLVRDAAAVVTSTRCAEEEERLFGGTFPPVCDELQIQSLGTRYSAFLLSRAHDELVVVHEGHKACQPASGLANSILPDAAALIDRLLERADVLYFDMPMLGTNCGQTISIKGISYSGIMHNWLGLIDEPGESGLAYFFDPLFWTLSFVSPRYRAMHMTGRSGGGWATTVYAALDWRIQRSVSVAGSLPMELRTPELDGTDDIGDWEQYAAYIYKLLTYQELYEAAGGIDDSRRHVQIYNEFDICCFKGAKGLAAQADYVASSKGYVQGRVRFMVNAGEREHIFPIDMVVEQLFGP